MRPKAVIYARGLVPEETTERLKKARAYAEPHYEIAGEFFDTGPCGFGRMSGWRRLLSAVRAEHYVVVVNDLAEFPVSLPMLKRLLDNSDIVTQEGKLDGLRDFIFLAEKIERIHQKERVRFSLRVAREIKRIGRPPKETRR